MNIYPSTKVRPYVYFGIDPMTGQFYIGYREINTKPSHIDLFEYRTSSAIVQPIFDQMNWFVLAEFETGDSAYDFEQQSIYENWDNPLLLNESCFYGKNRFKSKKGIHKGKSPWNKGKTKETDSRVLEYAKKKIGKTRPDVTERNKGNTYGKANKGSKGQIPWNKDQKGLQSGWNKGLILTDEKYKGGRNNKGKIPWNKGIKKIKSTT